MKVGEEVKKLLTGEKSGGPSAMVYPNWKQDNTGKILSALSRATVYIKNLKIKLNAFL